VLLGGIALSVVEPGLSACKGPASPPPAATIAAAPRELLSHLVERYWDENAASNPWYSWAGADPPYGDAAGDAIAPQGLADGLASRRRYLTALRDVAPAPLDAESKLTYDMFQRELELAIEGLTYPAELMPVTPYDSVPQRFAVAATAGETGAVSSDRQFEIWGDAAENYVSWTNQAIANMRDGLRRGFTVPRVLVEKMLPPLAVLGEDTQSNAFNQAARASNASDTAERKRRAAALADEISTRVLPAYRLLHDFLKREYLPRSRDSIALSSMPLGDAWYAYLAKRSTDGAASPQALHALGLAEVERLHGRLQAVLAETAFAGNPQAFFDDIHRDPRASYTSAEDLLAAYQALKPQVVEAMQKDFSALPRADLEVRGVAAFLQSTFPAASYRAATAYGKSAGVLYVNTASLDGHPATDLAAQFLREALPGHHYQLSLQRERSDLPRFRRFGGPPAFIEGWGLYAQALGEEMGMLTDSAAKFTALLAQLDCASLMVIDTGMQAKGWSRQQALDYLHAHLPFDDATIVNEVDRTIASPGAALACTAGYLHIQGLRTRAQQALGERFDLRVFHTELLKDGAIPLDMLDAKMKRWLDAAIAAPQDRSSPSGDSS
jgi:uncharacterized protein (DUF885 family)